MRVRDETPGDRDAVRVVNTLAFERDVEATLVDALRPVLAQQVSLVAVDDDDAVVGHVFFTPVTVRGERDEVPAFALGPMAVTPAWQRRGVGSALVRAGLERCRAVGETLVFVLGHPDFYPRFGFRPAWPRFWFGPRRDCPAFFVAELADDAARGAEGEVAYHPEFMKADG